MDAPGSIDEYIARAAEDERPALEAIRRTMREVMPEAEECISYGLPTYRLAGRNAIHFGAASRHYAIYGANVERATAEFAARLAPYSTSKGTIRFPKSEPLPLDLIADIARFAAESTLAKAAERRAARRGAARNST